MSRLTRVLLSRLKGRVKSRLRPSRAQHFLISLAMVSNLTLHHFWPSRRYNWVSGPFPMEQTGIRFDIVWRSYDILKYRRSVCSKVRMCANFLKFYSDHPEWLLTYHMSVTTHIQDRENVKIKKSGRYKYIYS